MDRCKGRGMFC